MLARDTLYLLEIAGAVQLSFIKIGEEKTAGIRHIAIAVDKEDFDEVVETLKTDDGVEELI